MKVGIAILAGLAGLMLGCSSEGVPFETVGAASKRMPIIGGEPDVNAGHDAVVMLLNTQQGSVCTGVVLSRIGDPTIVLTARHCVSAIGNLVACDTSDVRYDYDVTNIAVMKGSSPNAENAGLLGSGKQAFFPPTDATGICNNDVALLLLDADNTAIEPLRLRTESSRLAVGQTFSVIGYGVRQYPDPSGQTVGSRYIRDGVEVTSLGPVSPSLFDREYFGTEGICVGDSGGPAVSGSTVIGVASRVSDCYGGTGVWGRPDLFIPLIEDVFRQACASFVDEDGVLHPPDPRSGCPGMPTGGGGAAGAAGAAGAQTGAAGAAGVAGAAGAAGASGAIGSAQDFDAPEQRDSCSAAQVAPRRPHTGLAGLVLALAVLRIRRTKSRERPCKHLGRMGLPRRHQ